MHILIHIVLIAFVCILWDSYNNERYRREAAERHAVALQQTVARQSLQITQLNHTVRELQRHPPVRFPQLIRIPLLYRN
jgi:hypothetical protein